MIFFLLFFILLNSELFGTCNTKFLFHFKNENLSNLVNQIAAKKNLNILFDSSNKLSAKFSFSQSKEYDLDQAWFITQHLLNIAGFSVVKKKNSYQIISNKDVLREPLDIYINVDPNLIPQIEQKIRYLYLFDNLVLTPNSQIIRNLDQILKDMLDAQTNNYLLDSATNSLLISGNLWDIKGVIKIISELDKVGFREAIEVIPLMHTSADHIAKIISQLVTPNNEQKFGYFPQKSKQNNLYFSENTQVVSIGKSNSIAILGPVDSISKIKNFIIKYLDKPISSAKSLIHVRPLEYMDSNDLAPILQNAVKGKTQNSQAQSDNPLSKAIIITEQQVTTDVLKPTDTGNPAAANSGTPTTIGQDPTLIDIERKIEQLASGSNSLIIAANQNDWLELKKIIDEIDTPQPQIVADILIAELDITFTKELGSQTRNINNTNLPQTFNFQTANLAPPILNFNDDGTINTAKGLAADLLAPAPNTQNITNLATNSVRGSAMASFQDLNGVAYFTRLLNRVNNHNILFHSYVFMKNNYKGTITSSIVNFFPGDASSQQAGAFRIKRDAITATIGLDMIPTISKNQTINMDLNIRVEVFDAIVPGQVNSRNLSLKATVGNNEVLVVGGLMRFQNIITDFETPILSKIPIIGSLFYRKRNSALNKNPIYMFILPRIIKPKLNGGLSNYTKKRIESVKYELTKAEEALLGKNFTQLKDPITKFFIPTNYKDYNQKLDGFIKPSIKKEAELNNKIDKIKSNLKLLEVKN